jgi:hypothetical protein
MSFPVQNQVSDWHFIEIWVDPTASPPYLLMVLKTIPGLFYIIDPAENYSIIFSAKSYDEIKLWLLEDEYEQIDGRFAMEMEFEANEYLLMAA